MTLPAPFSGFYDYRLVALSISIAILASYAALDIATRINTITNKTRLFWLWGGATAMGTGIWAMHYTGMSAYRLPIAILYDWPTVALSLLAAVGASSVALYIASRPPFGTGKALASSVFMGGGIAATHYIGMEAMRLQASISYSPALVALSVVLPILVSWFALRLAFGSNQSLASLSPNKVGIAAILGLAISSMHYVGIAAVTFRPSPDFNGDLERAISVSNLALASITLATLIILAVAFLTSMIDRRLSYQAQEIINNRLQMQAIFENMKEGVVLLDMDRNVVQANPAALALLGLTHPAPPNYHLSDAFEIYQLHGEMLDPSEWPNALAAKGQFLHHTELELRRKRDGKTIVAEISTAPIRNQAGHIIQIIVTYRDITERAEIVNTRARLASIVDSSEDAIVGTDQHGIVRTWNLAARKIFGYTAEEMIGHSTMILVPADHEVEERDLLSRTNRGELIDHVETIRRRKDGRLITVSLTISPIRNARGQVTGASKVARDITMRKEVEQQLYLHQKMEALGQLTGGIAHDFNNLLGVVIGNLSLLELLIQAKELNREKALKFVATASKAAWRSAELIRRLLRFSVDQELNPDLTSLNHSIRNVIELAVRSVGTDIRINTQLDASEPTIFVDPAGLESALLNLAVNARDAMPNGGTIHIATAVRYLDEGYPPVKAGEIPVGTYASIALTDNGSGMSQETMSRVFEPFFTTKPRSKGTGLGLAMVYGFAKQSKGCVRIYSEVGYGTTVTLHLPVAGDLQHPAALPSSGATARAHAGGTVLVVDDEVDLLEVASAYLMQMGFQTLTATDGQSALKIVEQHNQIDLLLTDVIMPGGLNGVELAQKIRNAIPNIQVIYSSGFSENALAERSGTIVDGLLLNKPYQREQFTLLVSRAMEKLTSHPTLPRSETTA